jgi:hypothetical protein
MGASSLILPCGPSLAIGPTTIIAAELGGQTLVAGTYSAGATALGLTGVLTLSGNGVFIISTPAALTTAASSRVNLINGAECSKIQWNIGAAATLGASSFFVGKLQTGPFGAITVGASVSIIGSLTAGNGVITMGASSTVSPCPLALSLVVVRGELAGQTLSPGSYGATSGLVVPAFAGLLGSSLPPGNYGADSPAFSLAASGILTLSGKGVYTFSTPAALTTGASSKIILTNGADCSQIHWIVGAAATLGASSIFVGSIQTGPFGAITVGASAIVTGTLSAGNGVITLGALSSVISCRGGLLKVSVLCNTQNQDLASDSRCDFRLKGPNGQVIARGAIEPGHGQDFDRHSSKVVVLHREGNANEVADLEGCSLEVEVDPRGTSDDTWRVKLTLNVEFEDDDDDNDNLNQRVKRVLTRGGRDEEEFKCQNGQSVLKTYSFHTQPRHIVVQCDTDDEDLEDESRCEFRLKGPNGQLLARGAIEAGHGRSYAPHTSNIVVLILENNCVIENLDGCSLETECTPRPNHDDRWKVSLRLDFGTDDKRHVIKSHENQNFDCKNGRPNAKRYSY